MYMAIIYGYTEVMAFSEDMKTAQKLALKKKKQLCRDDLDKWTWETASEYYGSKVVLLSEKLVMTDGELFFTEK